MQKRRVFRHDVTQPSDPSYRLIALTRGCNAIVDSIDYEWLNRWNWQPICPDGQFYAACRINGTYTYMHRLIIGCQTTQEEADHKNHDTLDNRRGNLRKCTSAQNKWNLRIPTHNSSGFKGVSWDKTRHKWMSKIMLGRRTINIGRFDSVEDAARAYDSRAVELFGEFAHINFPTASE